MPYKAGPTSSSSSTSSPAVYDISTGDSSSSSSELGSPASPQSRSSGNSYSGPPAYSPSPYSATYSPSDSSKSPSQPSSDSSSSPLGSPKAQDSSSPLARATVSRTLHLHQSAAAAAAVAVLHRLIAPRLSTASHQAARPPLPPAVGAQVSQHHIAVVPLRPRPPLHLGGAGFVSRTLFGTLCQ